MTISYTLWSMNDHYEREFIHLLCQCQWDFQVSGMRFRPVLGHVGLDHPHAHQVAGVGQQVRDLHGAGVGGQLVGVQQAQQTTVGPCFLEGNLVGGYEGHPMTQVEGCGIRKVLIGLRIWICVCEDRIFIEMQFQNLFYC